MSSGTIYLTGYGSYLVIFELLMSLIMNRYGKFFGEELSLDCDKVTWTTWIYVSHSLERIHTMV